MNEQLTQNTDSRGFLGTQQKQIKSDKYFMLRFLSGLYLHKKNWIRGVTMDDADDPRNRDCTVTFALMPHYRTDNNSMLSHIRLLFEHADRFEYHIKGGILYVSLTVYDVWNDGKPYRRFTEYLSEEELEEIDREVDEMMDALTPEEIDEILNL
ncbi:MAG: hypothetical protein IJJ34_06875 [Clostridia bacterium]|nr:hypothetical protein [Clostridia bacterium]